MARPSKYQDEFCEKVEAALAEGYSIDACAGLIGVARCTVYDWAAKYPEFSDALKVGQAKSALWWEARLRNVAMNGGGPGTATAVIFGLKNRAPESWREKTETALTGPNGAAIETDYRVTFVKALPKPE